MRRRTFVRLTSAISAGYWIAPETARADGASTSANEQIRFACIGIGGKGASDSGEAHRHGKVVAVADVDANQLKRVEKAFPDAKPYADFRKMLDEMGREFDAVTVSTPDHTHIMAAGMAMGLGKHCFCQKPLTRTVGEARVLADLARSQKVATEMGNQGTATGQVRKLAAFIKGGGLGAVREVHIWTNRPVWPQGGAAGGEAGAREFELGSVAWPGGDAAVRCGLPSLLMARILGFRFRRPRRYGLPHDEHAVYGTRSAESDDRAGDDERP